MNPKIEKQETWREQLSRLAHGLCAGRGPDLADDLAPGSTPARIELFVEENAESRIEKLRQRLVLLTPAFPDLADLIASYVRSLPEDAYADPVSDGESFLDWLARTREPLPAQRDYIRCQRARHAVEEAIRKNRLGHVRFQDLRSLATSLADELETNRSLTLCLNPVRVWTELETNELLDRSAGLPAKLVFFPADGEIRTLVLDGEGLERVRELTAFGPVTLDAWRRLLEPFAGLCEISRRELASLCRELVRLGLLGLA